MSDVGELSCQELVELVTAYLDGVLSEAERARVEEHLADCEPCRVYIEQMERTIGLSGRLRVEDVPPEAAEALLAAFRGWRSAL
jgi:predicted anti-sigma-YlaC factor YlaD